MTQQKKKTVILQGQGQGQPPDTIQEKVIRHASIGVGVAVVTFLVDYFMYQYKNKKG